MHKEIKYSILANYQLIVYNISNFEKGGVLCLNNRIELSQDSIEEILGILKEKDKKRFRFLQRDIDTSKKSKRVSS